MTSEPFTFTGGLPETWCGLGSTLRSTETLRVFLPGALSQLEVKRLLDAPCGDFNWMSRTDLSRVDYLGVDDDEDHLGMARQEASIVTALSPRSSEFHKVDLLTDQVPVADAILCHDFLQHLPTARVITVLDTFVRSGARWLFVTSHDNGTNEDISELGSFRPFNLRVPPLSLPPPRLAVADPPGSGRILGVWAMTSVAPHLGT